ncbi:MAG: Gfo/Idh/MocA family protein [Candidatus Binatia bacterium]
MRLRLGLLGAGRRGKTHLSIIAGLADLFELVAICDVNEAGARALADKFGARAYADIEEFFSRSNLDVVDIVTPAESHHLMAPPAARHGVNMLIETPLAPTRAMMDSIGAAAARAGVIVEVAENFRRKPEALLNRKALETGLIGKPLRLTSFYEPIGQQGCYHSMSVFRLYAGAEVDEVRAVASRVSVEPSVGYGTTYDAESRTEAALFFANGMIGSCTYLSSWLSPLRRGHPHFLTVEGSAGFITSGRRQPNSLHRLEGGEQAVYGMKVETRRDGGREVPIRFYYETKPALGYINPFAARQIEYGDDATDVIAVADALVSIHRAVSTKSAPAYSVADARRDQELSIAISESAHREGEPVRLPLEDETAWEREQHEKFRARWGGDAIKDAEKLISRNFSGGSSP